MGAYVQHRRSQSCGCGVHRSILAVASYLAEARIMRPDWRPWLGGGCIGAVVGALLASCTADADRRETASDPGPATIRLAPLPLQEWQPREGARREFNGIEYWIVPLARSTR
jgi:hypothetical protein